jgi:electron transfer flavoprotein beta subunit
MKIVVLFKLVPDLVEELTIDAGGVSLDTAWLRLIINEFDDHAIEQAIIMKERHGGEVTVITMDVDGADDVLFTAVAKGADQLIKLVGDFSESVNNHALARMLLPVLSDIKPDLIMTGVQAHNDLDGPIGPLLAEYMKVPYVGYISGVQATNGKVSVRKEYPGGLIAEMDVSLPAVLGIQASEEPPRYVAVSKVRQAMKTASIQEQDAPSADAHGGLVVNRLFQPETSHRATMIDGDVDEIAARLVEILKEADVL